MGKVNAEGEMESITNIHESFLNSNCLQYHCRQMLVEMDLVPEKLGGGWEISLFLTCLSGIGKSIPFQQVF